MHPQSCHVINFTGLIKLLTVIFEFKMMETYYTPIKDTHNCSKSTKTAVQPREGDWICLNCNNLNFSFRKKCNRCKSSAAYYLDYYNQTYFCNPPTTDDNCGKANHAFNTANSQTHSHTPPKRKNRSVQNKENRTPSAHKRDLPSVSPLIKRYNARQTTPLSESRSQDSIWGVTVRDFQSILASSRRSDQYTQETSSQNWQREQEQLQRMISSIML